MDKQNAMIEENTRLLHQLRRYQATTFWMTMLWYALLIGLPFAVYYYVLGPYIQALGFGSDSFSGLRDMPGYQQFERFFGLEEGG